MKEASAVSPGDSAGEIEKGKTEEAWENEMKQTSAINEEQEFVPIAPKRAETLDRVLQEAKEIPKVEEMPQREEPHQGYNNNEKILRMHKLGMSKKAIAKELGLGVGEVKLVIDLFEQS